MQVLAVFVSLTGLLCGATLQSDRCNTDCHSTETVYICGTDRATYENKCDFQRAWCINPKLAVAYMGKCQTTDVKPATQLGTSGASSHGDKCNLDCHSTEKSPICGTDGVTYNNKCEFLHAKCSNASLDFAYEGQCQTTDVKPATQIGTSGSTSQTDKCHMNCDSTPYRVCGTDGKTYLNKCFFYEAKCQKDAAGEKFDLAHVGPCKTDSSLTGAVLTSNACSSDTRCDSSPQKICGSDGRYYGSACEFLKAKCANDRLTRIDCGRLTGVLG